MTTTADSTGDVPGTEDAQPVPDRSARIARRCLRAVTTVAAVDGLVQAALAGKFLAGNYDALDLHGTNSNIFTALTIAVLLVALEDRRLSRGRWWPVLGGVLLVAGVAAQSTIGWADVLLELHVPLGVSIVAGVIMMAVWSWRAPLGASPQGPSSQGPSPQDPSPQDHGPRPTASDASR